MTDKEEIKAELLRRVDINDVADAFKAGAQWQKQQMLKEAYPAEVNYWSHRGLSIRLEDVEFEDLAEEGEKVKVLFIKEK